MEIRVKEKRKEIFTLLLAFVAMMTLSACHDDKKEPSSLNPVDPTLEGQTFQQSVTLPEEKADMIVTLDSLESAINPTLTPLNNFS